MTPEPARAAHLSDAQLARVEALEASRRVQNRPDGFAKAAGPDPLDLVAVARFILDGDDPWADPEPPVHDPWAEEEAP